MRLRIVRERTENPEMTEYSVNFEISQYHELDFFRPLRESSEMYLVKAGEFGAKLLKELFAIPGVRAINLKPYSITVEKGKAFKWKDIDRAIEIQLRIAAQFSSQVSIAWPPTLREKIVQKWSKLKTIVRKSLSRKS